MFGNAVRKQVDKVRDGIRAYGDDLYAYVFGGVWELLSVVGVEVFRIYMIFALQFVVWTVLPILMIYASLWELSKVGTFGIALASSLALAMSVLLLLFVLLPINPNETPRGKSDAEHTGENSGERTLRKGSLARLRDAFVRIFRSISSLLKGTFRRRMLPGLLGRVTGLVLLLLAT